MIIHIDTGKTWRGGQQQAFYLHQHLYSDGKKSLMVCKKKSDMEKRCIEQGLPYHCLPLASEFDVYSGFMISRIVRDVIAPSPPFAKVGEGVVLHLHTAHALSIGLIAKWFKKDLSLVATRRVDFPIKKRSLFKYNHIYLDALVCVSKNVHDVAINDGIEPNKLRVIHSGIDTKRYAIQNCNANDRKILLSLYNIPKDRIIIGTIAALVGHKGYPTLLKAARIVLDSLSHFDYQEVQDSVTFLAIGDGKDKENLMKLHDRLNLGDSFIFAGFKDDVKSHLHLFDIFVLSSKSEGLGTSVLDAMSAKKPIVACDGGGIPEMIRHEINGLLAERENPVDLAEKILMMLKDKEMRNRFAQQSEIDVQEFSIESTIQKNIALYKELADTRYSNTSLPPKNIKGNI
jgi:glycosyltransferase involved in cell wall biosynthesis